MTTTYQAPTVKKAFKMLHLIARSDQGLTLSEISRRLAISKSTIHGIAAALQESGALIRDASTRRYTLGLTLFELGRSTRARLSINDAARPHMESLMSLTRESVYLGARNGDWVSVLDIVESEQAMKITSPPGTRIPLLAGATGKALLSAMSCDTAEALVRRRPLPRFTANTITDPDAFLAEVDRTRRRGYAIDREEYLSGVRAVAAAVHGPANLLSAIWVVGFKASITDRKLDMLAEETRNAARAITVGLEQEQPHAFLPGKRPV